MDGQKEKDKDPDETVNDHPAGDGDDLQTFQQSALSNYFLILILTHRCIMTSEILHTFNYIQIIFL